MKASIYWKELIWKVEDDNGKVYKVIISSSSPGQEYTKVTDEDEKEITGDTALRYIDFAKKAHI